MHVALRVAGALAVRLEHADGHEDLELADGRDVVPLLLGRHAGDVAAVRREPVLARHDRKRLHDEAEERGHGDAAVLDLGVAEVADRRLVAEAPEGVPLLRGSPSAIRLKGSQKPMVRPRRSGFDSARATISSLPLRAVPAAGATGATNAAAPVSARAATIFCIVPVLRGERGLLSRSGSVGQGLSLSLCATAATGACSRSLRHRRAAARAGLAAALARAPGVGAGDVKPSTGSRRPPQAGAAFRRLGSEASPPANENRCRASARGIATAAH